MQFHLDGFVAGDPLVSAPDERHRREAGSDALPAEVDVLIVGCGPTGLTLAAQLSAFPEIRTCILERKSGPLLVGQADGIACRSMEMFEAFNFSERVLREAYWVNETTFWKPDETHPESIARSGRIQDTEDGLSEFPHVILNQARVHDFLLETMRNSATRLEPDYNRQVLDLTVAEGPEPADYPVTVRVGRSDPDQDAQVETVRARYVIGCDGARSKVRTSIGRALRGDAANQAWGVMDVLAVTDFPDIRLKSTVHSSNEGNMLIIPREGGYMVRLYIELDQLGEGERLSNRDIKIDDLVSTARRILRPYTLEVEEVAWWSIYEIGQRLCDKFDDVPVGDVATRLPRVFIAGDACHTHSPKAGQGMNISMRDGFNLGWKLASVLRGQAGPDILHTYSAERTGEAKQLIDFDREFARMFSARPKTTGADAGIDPKEFQEYFVQHGRFTAGTATRYGPSMISAAPTHQRLATGFQIGMRFHSAPVVRLADARPMHLGHVAKADGRWRLYAFADAGDPHAETSRLRELSDFLADAEDSPLRRYTPHGTDIDSVIDVRAVLQQAYRSVRIERMPALLLPRKGRYGLCDYEKVFCPDLKRGEDIFEMRGIDRSAGCMVITRPDQHVANVLPLDAFDALSDFFGQFMRPAN